MPRTMVTQRRSLLILLWAVREGVLRKTFFRLGLKKMSKILLGKAIGKKHSTGAQPHVQRHRGLRRNGVFREAAKRSVWLESRVSCLKNAGRRQGGRGAWTWSWAMGSHGR